ncbi:unnamed protein product, partial [Bubo scandiacus]
MRGAGGTREPPGPGLGSSSFGAAPAACPWGCVLGPGGWSGAPFCPWHRLPAEAERSRRQVRGDRGGGGRPEPREFPAGGTAASPGPVPPPLQLPARGSGTARASWRSPARRRRRTRRGSGSASPGTSPARTATPPTTSVASRNPSCARSPPAPPPSALEVKLQRLPVPWGHQLTAEEAERNARELVAEEERMKRKAEKKKLKRKKQKDRKKREKLGQELQSQQEAETAGPSPSPCLGGSAAASGEEEMEVRAPGVQGLPCSWAPGPPRPPCLSQEELDLSCTFVFKARQKAGVRLLAPGKEKPARSEGAELGRRPPGKVPPPVPVPDTSVVQQSLILAGRGNEAAQKGHYAEAVQAFTEAVKLNPREHRLFGNRSYCYEKLRRYEEALRDAQVSLGLRPGWPKGFFRKGKALRGLQRYAEAAGTFEELLRLDGANADAAAQLEACRALLRQRSARSSPGGVPMSPSLLEAGEPPLPPAGEGPSGSCGDTDTSGFVTVVSSRSQARGQGRPAASSQQTLPPTHPARDCFPLWVGYGTPGISEKVLQSCFGRFGEIRFIRVLPERHCAFINYTRKKAAEAAYTAMQDAELEGSRLALQLKHPSHATPSPRRHPEPWGEGGCPPWGAPV